MRAGSPATTSARPCASGWDPPRGRRRCSAPRFHLRTERVADRPHTSTMIAWLLIYVGVIALSGAALTAAILGARRQRLADVVGLSGALGCGGVATLLMWISMVGFKPSRGIVLAIGVVAIVALIALRRRLPRLERPLAPPARITDALTLIAFALVTLQFACAAAFAFLPAFEIDAIAIWGLKAKVIYFQPLHPRPEYFSDLSLSFTHLDYPLL